MEEQFLINYDLCLKLKEKGYDLCSFAYFNSDKEFNYSIDELNSKFVSNTGLDIFWEKPGSVVIPLLQQVIDWFELNHDIEIETMMNWKWIDEDETLIDKTYTHVLLNLKGAQIVFLSGKAPEKRTRLLAIIEGIKEALTLI
jgi:hypothetical protein